MHRNRVQTAKGYNANREVVAGFGENEM